MASSEQGMAREAEARVAEEWAGLAGPDTSPCGPPPNAFGHGLVWGLVISSLAWAMFVAWVR